MFGKVCVLLAFLFLANRSFAAFPPSLDKIAQNVKNAAKLQELFAQAKDDDIAKLGDEILDNKVCDEASVEGKLSPKDQKALKEIVQQLKTTTSGNQGLSDILEDIHALGSAPSGDTCHKTFDAIRKFEQNAPKSVTFLSEQDLEKESFNLQLLEMRTKASRRSALFPDFPGPSPVRRRLLFVPHHVGAYAVPKAVKAAVGWAAFVAGGGPGGVKFGGQPMSNPPGGTFSAHDAAKAGAPHFAHTGAKHVGKTFTWLCINRACPSAYPLVGGVAANDGHDFSSFTNWQQAALAIAPYYNNHYYNYINARFFAKPKMKTEAASYNAPGGLGNARTCYRSKVAAKAGYAKHQACGGGGDCHCKSAAPVKIMTVIKRPGFVYTHYPSL